MVRKTGSEDAMCLINTFVQAIKKPEANPNKAPTAITFSCGFKISATPTKPLTIASSIVRLIFSPKNKTASKVIKMGEVVFNNVASASPIFPIARKKQVMAQRLKRDRIRCVLRRFVFKKAIPRGSTRGKTKNKPILFRRKTAMDAGIVSATSFTQADIMAKQHAAEIAGNTPWIR